MYFWDTVETIPDGVGFRAFDLLHIGWLVLSLLAVIGFSVYYRRADKKGRAVWRKTIAILLVLDEVFKQVCLLIGGNWLTSYLPLHLCSINIFVIVWHAWKPGKYTGNFLYTVCIPGAAAALLFPSWASLPLGNFMHIHSFTVHMLLMLYPIVLTAAGDIRPDIRTIPKCLAVLIGMAVIAYFINTPLDANFFFMAHADEGNPLGWFEENWGNHLYGFPVLVTVIIAVMHGPWLIAGKIRKKA